MTLWTLTSWLVNSDSTNGIYSTSCSKTTRIYAFAFFARLAGRTVKVCSAFAFFLRGALNQWVSIRLVSRTHAQSNTTSNSAQSIESAACISTRVNQRSSAHTARESISGAARLTLAVIAANKVLADGVFSTGTGEALVLVRDTLNVGISNIFLWAGTFLLVPDTFALSRDSTGIWQ
jgi:hypothetical protein